MKFRNEEIIEELKEESQANLTLNLSHRSRKGTNTNEEYNPDLSKIAAVLNSSSTLSTKTNISTP